MSWVQLAKRMLGDFCVTLDLKHYSGFCPGTCLASMYTKLFKRKARLKPLRAPSTQPAFQNWNKGTFVLSPGWLQSIFKNIWRQIMLIWLRMKSMGCFSEKDERPSLHSLHTPYICFGNSLWERHPLCLLAVLLGLFLLNCFEVNMKCQLECNKKISK